MSERERRYGKISITLTEENEEDSDKMPFQFQMKGSCRRNESIF
jgi:hypothetical protein